MLILLALFPIKWFWSTEFWSWIQSKFSKNCKKWIQSLILSSLENNPIMMPTLTTKDKIFHSSVSTFDINEVGSKEEISKSLSFSKVSWSFLTKCIFLVCFPRYFSSLVACTQIRSVGSSKMSATRYKEVESLMTCACMHLESLFLCFGSTDVLFQMKNLLIQTKTLIFWYKTLNFDQNTRYFEYKILK